MQHYATPTYFSGAINALSVNDAGAARPVAHEHTHSRTYAHGRTQRKRSDTRHKIQSQRKKNEEEH